jgi:hypothetical protein
MMNYNISAYLVFIAVMVFIIVYVGRYFFTNGRVFIISMLEGNVELADQINRLLLLGYYLVNIGYAFIRLKDWPTIYSLQNWISSLGANIGLLVLILAVMHYMNMLGIYLFSKTNSIHHKRFNYEQQ